MRIILFFTIIMFIGCSPELSEERDIIPKENLGQYEYFNEDLIPYFGNSQILLDSTNSELAALGRLLFYDTRLSSNDQISCASCHKQHQSFSDGKRNSPGFQGDLTLRNSLSLINVAFQKGIFWDTSGEGLHNDVLRPIINPIEMGFESLDEMALKISRIKLYQEEFKLIYGDNLINKERIGVALSQFVGALISYQSKFDQGVISGFQEFSESENKGMDLFFGKALCARCHNSPFFAGDRNIPVNIGLDLVYEDKGNENGKFKVPTLRNIALSGPYMHDGRFENLNEVIRHYNSGIQNHPHLSSQLKDPLNSNEPVRLNLMQEEIDALIAFLHTLTDYNFTNDERFSNPF